MIIGNFNSENLWRFTDKRSSRGLRKGFSFPISFSFPASHRCLRAWETLDKPSSKIAAVCVLPQLQNHGQIDSCCFRSLCFLVVCSTVVGNTNILVNYPSKPKFLQEHSPPYRSPGKSLSQGVLFYHLSGSLWLGDKKIVPQKIL